MNYAIYFEMKFSVKRVNICTVLCKYLKTLSKSYGKINKVKSDIF